MKTFSEIRSHARARAAKSAKRNDPQAWAYWIGVEDWARELEIQEVLSGTQETAREFLRRYLDLIEKAKSDRDLGAARALADYYSRVKWCATVLRARGETVRLSLDWLRKFEGERAA